VHKYKVAEHLKSMTKVSKTLFDGNPENLPALFENHLIRKAENLTIGYSNDILSFKVMGQEP
jgi:hypothetical protein